MDKDGGGRAIEERSVHRPPQFDHQVVTRLETLDGKLTFDTICASLLALSGLVILFLLGVLILFTLYFFLVSSGDIPKIEPRSAPGPILFVRSFLLGALSDACRDASLSASASSSSR